MESLGQRCRARVRSTEFDDIRRLRRPPHAGRDRHRRACRGPQRRRGGAHRALELSRRTGEERDRRRLREAAARVVVQRAAGAPAFFGSGQAA
jgi:hypothetical protein